MTYDGATRVRPKTILHVDMDAFYAAVEQRDDPTLRGRPVIVGGRSRRGVVLAASYEVRPFGVRSAMSMSEALRLAPHAIVVPPHRDRYEQASDEVFAIFQRYTPLVQPLSLDEAFLDVTGSTSLFGSGQDIAAAIKRDVRADLGLTASAGVAPCRFVAKIASDLRKPDGLVVVEPSEVVSFLAPLPIERMWGIGPKTAPRMRALGYTTLGDLARADEKELERNLGSWGAEVARLARGVDARDVIPDALARSISAEQTYENDLVGSDAVRETLLEHASRIARRLVRSDLGAHGVALKVKYSDFTLRTRRTTLPDPVQATDAIHGAAVGLLAQLPLEGRRVRLTGVSATGLVEVRQQRSLFPDARAEKGRAIEQVAARIADRFDDERALTRASLLGKPRG
jgi:DNA polymerase-4